jgi:hypothetical protein
LKRRKKLKNETIKICESFMDDTLYHYCRSHYRIINIKKGIDFKIYVFFYDMYKIMIIIIHVSKALI